MKQLHYLDCSMYGSYYRYCMLLDREEDGSVWVLFFDPWTEEYVVQHTTRDRLEWL